MRDLAHPPHRAELAALCETWTYEVFRFSAPCPPGLEDYPELSLRLRGAFGAALARQPPSPGQPHAYHVLFAPITALDAGEIPRPFVLRGWIEGARAVVELRLFGWAVAWRDAASAALLDALRTGVTLADGRRARVSINPDDLDHKRFAFIDTPENACYAALRFRSPVAVRQRALVHAAPQAILKSAARRVGSMALWQGAKLHLDDTGLHRTLDRLDLDTNGWLPYRWTRHSRRQGDTPIPMEGWLGSLVVRGPLGSLAPLLSLAQTCNLGSHAGLGLGWFDLVLA